MKVLFSLLLVALVVDCSIGLSCAPTGVSFVPDLMSCSLYYLCDNGHLTALSCPNGYFFSATLQMCTTPQEADCTVPRMVCPWDTPAGEVFLLANGRNCHEFFQCTNSVPVPGNCPTGLVFNRDLGVCDATTECVVSRE